MGRESGTLTCSNCGAELDEEEFCPECGQWVGPTSEEEAFQPFELSEAPPPDDDRPYSPPAIDAPPEVSCPSCGSMNPAYNRHCEECGARLAQGPLPVAPPPMIRTTAGTRALMALAAVILVVALLALLVNLFRSPGEVEASAESQATTTTAGAQVEIQELTPVAVEASSSLPGFEAAALIDDDPENSWNDASLGGEEARLTFNFGEPVQIASIVIHNLQEEDRFKRNFRIKGYQITIDDLDQSIPGELDDTMEPQTIQVSSLRTTVLTLEVTSTYPAQQVDGVVYDELALQEVEFFGRPAP